MKFGRWALLSLLAASAAAQDRSAEVDGAGSAPGEVVGFGSDLDAAVEIADGVFQARGIGNTQLVATPEGNVIIDTGLPTESPRHRSLLDEAAPGPARYVVLTHAHLDHAGGATTWMDEGTEVIAHARFPETQRYLGELMPSQMRRNRVLVFGGNPDRRIASLESAGPPPPVEPDILVHESVRFELGGVRFDVIATPGAEGEDSVSVWLPDRKILFSGDFLGPIFPMWPNLYSLRGEKIRFAMDYIDSLDRVMALEPELLVMSHFEPVYGKEAIHAGLRRIRDAVAYVHDEVVRGMNAGRSVYELMREIRLPPELELTQERGKVSWGVRSIYEGYAGWFHFRSTTQLYPVPVSGVYPELAELAGGPEPLAERAAAHVRAGRPVEALHLAEIALAAESGHRPALESRLAALETLLERSGGETLYEVRWLRQRILETRQALAGRQ